MEIFYTGIGCSKTEFHTEREFLNIMDIQFKNKRWNCNGMIKEQLQFNDWILPDDFIFFTLYDWIEYSGAEIKV
jgi:hypothetical protein